MEEAGAVNRKILEFCKENGVSGNRANLAAVCAEEMTVNIIKFGGKIFQLDRHQSLPGG